uniref:Translation initiation factor eIF2B subunit delta n=1 Tax=Parascaris univalens TaxID=6257 RepID=A0A915ABQ8_PARUN
IKSKLITIFSYSQMGGGKRKNPPNNRQQTIKSKPQQQQQQPSKTARVVTGEENGDIIGRPPANESAEVKELLKSVVDLRITSDSPATARSSKETHSHQCASSQKQFGEGSTEEQPTKTKEEIMAERKAKAAEAKARKAAAAAARKAISEDGSSSATNEPQTNEHNKKKHEAKEREKSNYEGKPKESKQKEFPRNEISEEKRTKPNGSDIVKSAISSKSSSARPAQPFKHVHFDMTPSEDNVAGQRRRHPSFTEVSTANVHASFLSFAARCEAKDVVGIDAVCVAFIHAFKEFLSDYVMNENRKMSHDLDQAIRPHFSYLTQNGSQPFPLALGNLIRQLKKEINRLPDDISELDGKNALSEWLDDFCSQNFDLALRAISSFCLSKMISAPYILTYSWCPVVERILLDAYEQKLCPRVCVLDSPVEPRGRQLVKMLCARNIECTYGMLSAIGYVMKECRLVLLGCSAILSNGCVVADRGASQVALVAAASNVPVLVVAQTLKFVDRVQTFDRSAREVSALIGERQETIPADLVTAVVTELRIVPPSSAPAVLKAKQLAIGLLRRLCKNSWKNTSCPSVLGRHLISVSSRAPPSTSCLSVLGRHLPPHVYQFSGATFHLMFVSSRAPPSTSCLSVLGRHLPPSSHLVPSRLLFIMEANGSR